MNKYLGEKKSSKKIKVEKDNEVKKKVSFICDVSFCCFFYKRNESIAKLREERLKREEEERKKVANLLYSKNENPPTTQPRYASSIVITAN